MDYTAEGNIVYTKGDRCGVDNCNARRYYIEEGFTYCKNGHQQDIVSNKPHKLLHSVASSVITTVLQGPQTQAQEDDLVRLGQTTSQKRELLENVSQRTRILIAK